MRSIMMGVGLGAVGEIENAAALLMEIAMHALPGLLFLMDSPARSAVRRSTA